MLSARRIGCRARLQLVQVALTWFEFGRVCANAGIVRASEAITPLRSITIS